MLENTYYKMISEHRADDAVVFEVALLPDHPVYAGHFPGNPVSPGVCNMQMLKELAERIVDKPLFLSYIDKYRLMEVITPAKHPCLTITMTLTAVGETYKMESTVTAGDKQCITFKGELTEFVNP